MSGWIGWLVLFAALAGVVALLRGIVQLVSWCIDEWIVQPRQFRLLKSHERPPKPQSGTVASKPKAERHRAHHDRPHRDTATIHLATKTADRVRRPSRLGRFWKSLEICLGRKSFDHWVAAAMSEDDPELKIKCLEKALKLNPDYLPAWGMEGNALFSVGRYDEAIQCFDRSLQLHPSALIWQKKGECWHRLGRREEALDCLHEAIQTCPDQERELLDEISRLARQVENELRVDSGESRVESREPRSGSF